MGGGLLRRGLGKVVACRGHTPTFNSFNWLVLVHEQDETCFGLKLDTPHVPYGKYMGTETHDLTL